MNIFEAAMQQELQSKGWVPVKRRGHEYWTTPDEPGVYYYIADAVVEALKDAA